MCLVCETGKWKTFHVVSTISLIVAHHLTYCFCMLFTLICPTHRYTSVVPPSTSSHSYLICLLSLCPYLTVSFFKRTGAVEREVCHYISLISWNPNLSVETVRQAWSLFGIDWSNTIICANSPCQSKLIWTILSCLISMAMEMIRFIAVKLAIRTHSLSHTRAHTHTDSIHAIPEGHLMGCIMCFHVQSILQ